MSDLITVRGFVATDPNNRTMKSGQRMSSFRLASTERRFDKQSQGWVDGTTNWYTVNMFRALAENVTASIHKGQPVLVAGRLRTNVWTKEGVTYERLTLEATTVGHDLTRGTATFFRARTEEAHEDRDLSLGEIIGRVESQPVAGLDEAEVAALQEPTEEDGEERIDEDGVVSRVA